MKPPVSGFIFLNQRMKRRLFISICISVFGVLNPGCSGGGGDRKESTEKDTLNKKEPVIRIANTGWDAEPRLGTTDSIQVLFYDDPDGDSLRYSRYFRYTTTGDSVLIRQLLSGFQNTYSDLAAPRDCRSEGKMYLFAGEQELKTVYFSTRCDTCCYLYFIRDGRFLYFSLEDEARKQLSALKKRSRRP